MSSPSILVPLCNSAHLILSRYYGFGDTPDFSLFLLPPSEELGCSGRILYEHVEASDEVFLGLQFGDEIAEHCRQMHAPLKANTLAIIAEETSHLQAILDGHAMSRSISRLNLEVLGEIDRFLTLMHWNSFAPERHIEIKWRNLHALCDFMFTGNRFDANADPLYFDAEALALGHLRKAFADQWDNSHTDFTSVSERAREYLQEVRVSLFRPQELTRAVA